MGIVVMSAGCEGGSEVQGKSRVPRCHSLVGEDGLCRLQGRPPGLWLGSTSGGYSCSSSGEGEARVSSVVPLQS